MLNMGGPCCLAAVQPFLLELFNDREIIRLPFQSILGPMIARLRAPEARRRYARIGGASPILHWTNLQGMGMVERLDRICPETAPHRFYPAFRYAPPFTREALLKMKADGVRRAVAFSQYPQYSGATTATSLNELQRCLTETGLENEFEWSVFERWPTHPGFIAALADSVRRGLEKFPPEDRRDVTLLFSAHSLPVKMVRNGDPYPREIEAGVNAVMRSGGFSNEYRLSYQSATGPVKWLGPQTGDVIRLLGKQKTRGVLVVPIAFVNDHIETLYEIDVEYRELAGHCGIGRFERAPALNDSPLFLDALAEMVATHIKAG
jgi:ferrochelatase